MGIFDFITGGSGPAKALKLKAKVTQKYGDPLSRQKAIAQLGDLPYPEAISVLLARFPVTVEPASTDADEKEQTFELIKARGQDAVTPVKEFLFRNDSASSWALRILSEVLPETEVNGIAVELLNTLGAGYTRDPERKVVMLHYLEGKKDPRIVPAVLPFLEDMADDVKVAALKVLSEHPEESIREPILKALTHEETARRVQAAALAALATTGLSVQGYREKVEALLPPNYLLDKAGVVKRRDT